MAEHRPTGSIVPDTKAQAREDRLVNTAINAMMPYLKEATVGGVSGWCVGYTAKSMGKVAATILGAGFIAVQVASYSGYLTVHWDKVERDVKAALDQNGDGEIDAEDLQTIWSKVSKVLKFNLPSSTGFAAGFLFGLRS